MVSSGIFDSVAPVCCVVRCACLFVSVLGARFEAFVYRYVTNPTPFHLNLPFAHSEVLEVSTLTANAKGVAGATPNQGWDAGFSTHNGIAAQVLSCQSQSRRYAGTVAKALSVTRCQGKPRRAGTFGFSTSNTTRIVLVR